MAQLLSDRRDIEFVIHEQLQTETLASTEKFADFNKKTIDLILNEARSLAQKEVVPTNTQGDQEGCRWENGTVYVPESFHQVWKLYREGEWIAMAEDPEWGGQGMPKTLTSAAIEYLNGANCALFMYVAVTYGAANLIETFGTEKQKKLFLEKMYSGEWAGTMMLTEANAGSDLAAIESTARDNGDGTYSITGDKVFISGGEQDLTDNIVHPVLARIEGAPVGTKGISLFLVPKFRVNADGSLGEFNNIICTGIEHKMGIHGNATCSLSLGSKGECIGTLLGEENRGLKAMFQMMNEARLYVGIQGLSLAASSYANAVDYAKQRIQGAELTMEKKAVQTPVTIIQHPDIRRQLCLMKAYVEGMRSLIYYTSNCFDQQVVSVDSDEKAELNGIIDLLIPIVKGYITDRAFEVCSHGLQVFGGYGYIEEFPQSQLLRDCRITLLYEGTNGIQAMDLLSRKLLMDEGRSFTALAGRILDTIDEAKKIDELRSIAEAVNKSLSQFEVAFKRITCVVQSGDLKRVFAYAYPIMEVLGDILIAWMLLWRASISVKKLEKPGKDQDFYTGQIKSAEFFISNVLPITHGKLQTICDLNNSVNEMPEKSFHG